LKKTRRNIFSTKEGFRITYFDFRNYEPGIAAGLSNDKAFIEYYNTGDMYSKIANELFRNPLKRKEVKITILSSLYGMSKESLVKYFSKSYDFNPLIVVDLLESFKVFCSWRKDIIDQAINAKVVIDKSYTRRYLPNNDWKIRTSALNHIIQSTGSRILKKCIAEIINISGVRILIPMHDALLCEVADENYVALTKIVIAQMEVIFKEEIVNVSSKVIISDFSQ
jgi:DNA polymerase I-like protein with 3'-5' exonuclease and polymerase domains